MGQMGINPQLVDVMCPCREGWEGPERASSLHYAEKGHADAFTGGIVTLSVSFRGKYSHLRPEEKGASNTK